MNRLFKRIRGDIQRGENIDLLATVLLVLVIAVADGLGIASESLVTSITLAVLGLIAVGLLVTRYRIEDLHRVRDVNNAVKFFARKPHAELSDQYAVSKEVWLLGLTLRQTTTDNFYNFKSRASRGVKFRVMIVNADKVEASKVVRQFFRGGTEEQFRADFIQTLNQYKEIRLAAKNPENVQVRLLDFIPSCSMYIFPKADEGGVLFVETYGYKSSLGSVPKFCLTERENPEWYKHFTSQFETIWNDAETISW